MDAHAIVLMITVAVASAVEMVEAMTILLACGITRGWRSTLEGGALALVVLVAIVAILGPALVNYVPIHLLRVFVGTLLLMFGLQWLRKAILRASGNKALHDEDLIFQKEVKDLSKAGTVVRGMRDPVSFAVSFKGVFLEGLEVVVIVLSFGIPAGHLGLATISALGAAAIVTIAGIALSRPLAAVPENSMKLGVAIMLTTFGIFWMGEGAGLEWPSGDFALLYLVAFFAVISLLGIRILSRSKQTRAQGATS